MDPNQVIFGWIHEKLVTVVHGVSLGAARGLERDFHSILVDGLNFVFPRYIS